MDIHLAECFKDYCNERLKELIDSSYIRIDNLFENDAREEEVIIVCEIFTPFLLFYQLKMYEVTLLSIGNILDIDCVHIIPIQKTHLFCLKQQAEITKDLESSRLYLELQYLF
ncbi:MAG: hypothetical protein ACFBSE_20090 [Prochloraceae cyanobacterium]